jgi:hypothetical protein
VSSGKIVAENIERVGLLVQVIVDALHYQRATVLLATRLYFVVTHPLGRYDAIIQPAVKVLARHATK